MSGIDEIDVRLIRLQHEVKEQEAGISALKKDYSEIGKLADELKRDVCVLSAMHVEEKALLNARIANLEAENEKLKKALRRIAACKHNPDPLGYLPAIAIEALGEERP